MGKYLLKAAVLIGAVIMLESCAPVFSELQSARTVGKNRVEITPFSTSTRRTDYETIGGGEGHAGFLAAYGITNKIDLRFRYEYLYSGDVHVMGFGPKINIIEEKLSIVFPIGRALGKSRENTWEFHPTVLASFPVIRKRIEANVSSKVLISQRNTPFYAFNIGLAASMDLADWAVRPEYGILLDPSTDRQYEQFSLGFSFAFF